MKSLEIVNDKIEEAKSLKGSVEQPVWDDETIINKEEIEQIKQDLEVLEIIKNKKVDLQGLSYLLNEYKDAELAYILNQYNPTEYYTRHLRGCLTLEELLKLKQWLENNND